MANVAFVCGPSRRVNKTGSADDPNADRGKIIASQAHFLCISSEAGLVAGNGKKS